MGQKGKVYRLKDGVRISPSQDKIIKSLIQTKQISRSELWRLGMRKVAYQEYRKRNKGVTFASWRERIWDKCSNQ